MFLMFSGTTVGVRFKSTLIRKVIIIAEMYYLPCSVSTFFRTNTGNFKQNGYKNYK